MVTLTEFKPSITEYLNLVGADIEEAHDGWNAILCPFHEDSHTSGSFNEEEGIFRCFACDVKGDVYSIISQTDQVSLNEARDVALDLGLKPKPVETKPKAEGTRRLSGRMRETLNRAAAQYGSEIDGAKEFLAARGIGRDAALSARLGYVATPLPGHEAYAGKLAIPYVTESGVVDIRFRCAEQHSCKDYGHPKYLSLPGSQTRMYGVTSILEADDMIAVTEGELDAVVLAHCVGIPAVGIPGATNWKPHYRRVLEDFDSVFIFGDGDKAGNEFTSTLVKELDGAVPVRLPDGKDVNDLYLSGGAEAIYSLIR